jgi:hypothetical protein
MLLSIINMSLWLDHENLNEHENQLIP